MDQRKKTGKGRAARWVVLAVLALVGIAAAALGAATLAAFTSSLHAQRTIAAYDTEGARFSSNYLMRGESRDNVRTIYTTNTAVSPSAIMTICNYQQGKQTMPNPDALTYSLTARLVKYDANETDLYVPVDAAYMSAQGYTAYSVTINDGVNTVTLNSSHLSDTSLGGSMTAATAQSDPYLISFSPHFAENDPNLYLEVIATPTGNNPVIRGIFAPALRAEGASNHWTGPFRDDSATAPAGYDGFNFLLEGTGQGTAVLSWDSTKVVISDVSLEMLLNIDGASRSGNSITFPVDSDVESRYDLQFYKADGSDFTGVNWATMNSSIVQFSFS